MIKKNAYCLLLLAITLSDVINAVYEVEWNRAKEKYSLSFKDSQAERKAFNTYAYNMEVIEKENSFGNLGYVLGENAFTHLTAAEFEEKYLIKPGVLATYLSNEYNIPIQGQIQVGLTTTTTKTATTTKAPTKTTKTPTTTKAPTKTTKTATTTKAPTKTTKTATTTKAPTRTTKTTITTKAPTRTTKTTITTKAPTKTTTFASVPDSVNYTYLYNTAKDQKSCGSCYTFASAAVMEGQYALKYGTKISLSEQQLLDCTYNSSAGNFGCGGGWSDFCFNYANKTGMIKTSDYAYKATLSTCPTTTIQSVTNRVYVSQFGTVKPVRDETVLKNYIALNGPISVYIYAVGGFMSYKEGIMYNVNCTSSDYSINHAVTLVGYGTENGQDYWLIRNSWGTSWGMNGYAKMARNRDNNCRIASYPIFAKIKYI